MQVYPFEKDRPNCFGQSDCFDEDDEDCRTCDDFQDCKDMM